MPSQIPTSEPSLTEKASSFVAAIRTRDWKTIHALSGLRGSGPANPHLILASATKQFPIGLLRQMNGPFDELAKKKILHLESLGYSWFSHDCFGEAEQSYRRALILEPTNLDSILGLANCLLVFARFEEARQLLETARSLDPLNSLLLGKLGSIYLQQNETEDALAAFQLAEEQGGPRSKQMGMRFIQALAYLPDVTDADLMEAGEAWEQTYALPRPRPPLRKITDRIRIGYYTPDFRNHSTSYFLRPILREYDRSKFEVFLYSDSRLLDYVTDELRSYADHWRDFRQKNDTQALEMMRRDELHLLVDLTGYFGEARPWLFANRPAPTQAHLIGYNGTTGLSSLDYRISDATCDPPENGHLSSEEVVHLDPGFHCFHQEPGLTISEGEAPCLSQTGITFGCYNNSPKLNDEVLDAWTRILLSVPDSRLILKITSKEDLGGQDRMVARFTSRGIEAERIVIIPRTGDKTKHLESHRLVDIILDPFPVSGTTTTFEAIWMGVPVLTLLGNRHSARVSSSILRQVGLPEGITHTLDEYIQRATDWSQDRPQIQKWRQFLRKQLELSSAGQAKPYVLRLEEAFLTMVSPTSPQ